LLIMPVTGYDKLINEVNAMLQTDRIMIAAMNSVLVKQKERIFQDGRAADGSNIGTYKTNGSRKSRRSRIGQKVVLRESNQMMMDLTTHVLGNNEYGIGFNNSFNKDKAVWNEDRFGKDIFSSSDEEDELVLRVIDFELKKID
jgi:hypothetical protein